MPELDDAALERRLRGVLQEHLGALPLDLTVDALDRRREAQGLARRSGRGRGITLLAAAALLLVGGALAAGSGLLRLPSVVPPVPAPSVVAVATTSPDATSPSPSMLASPTPVPSATPAPITWTEASLKEDWPAPVRPEPAGGGSVITVEEEADRCILPAEYPRCHELIPDPLDDTGSAAHPWVDIRELQGGGARIIIEVGSLPPFVAPTEQWFAYGVVVDDDRDGIPDRRFGFDNIPGTAPGGYDHRAWITDLHTGRTVVADSGFVGETKFDPFFPGSAPYTTTGAMISFGGQNARGGVNPGLVDPFYVWASVIENGRVVATDYAPDVGWLLEAESAPEVEPTPVPGPTPQVKDDPDVPGGRLWTTTVINNSPDPATFFVAEEDGSGAMGRLVGTVTPNVVPAGTTVKVTFALPPEGSRGWFIFVNPGDPDGGGLVGWTDAPLPGYIHISEHGQVGWVSP